MSEKLINSYHPPGTLIRTADRESWDVSTISTIKRLWFNHKIFAQINSLSIPFGMDLFANRLNARLGKCMI